MCFGFFSFSAAFQESQILRECHFALFYLLIVCAEMEAKRSGILYFLRHWPSLQLFTYEMIMSMSVLEVIRGLRENVKCDTIQKLQQAATLPMAANTS